MATKKKLTGRRAERERTDEIKATVQRLVEEAVRHYEENLEPEQVKATEYYRGDPFGNEEEGRSKVVSTDLRDAVGAVMPSLMRVFFGPERVVEYRPRGKDDEQKARQATDYVNYVFTEENPGFLILHSAFKDAFIRKLGIVKWWWEDFERVSEEAYTGISEDDLIVLSNTEGVEVEVDQVVAQQAGIDPSTGEVLTVNTYDVRVRRTEQDGRVCVAAIPPEEFVFSPHARCLEDAPLVAHRRRMKADEVIAMGIDRELVERKKGETEDITNTQLEFTRRQDADVLHRDEVDESVREVLYTEAYALIDGDGDGRAELRLFKCVGEDYEVANGRGDVVDCAPFALFTPDPEPHTIVGFGLYDYLKDIQLINSQLWRGMLNSLSKAIDSDLEVVTGEVNMQDVLSKEASKIIRVRRPGMLRDIQHPFVGADVLSVLTKTDEMKENRTGMSKASAGLDPDSLQSATKAAVAATISASQQRLEMFARVFAETGMKQLFKGLLKLITRYQQKERIVRLRGEYVTVDPRSWDATMDVSVNVALGTGTVEEKLAALAAIAEKQELQLQMGTPLQSWSRYRNTLARSIEILGFRNADEFFPPFGPEEEQAMQQAQAQQPPPPDPNMMLVEIEGMRLQMQQLEARTKLELERMKILLDDDRERDKIAREMALKEREIEAKFAADINDAQLKAQVAADRAAMDADIRREQMNRPTAEAT